MSLDFDLTRVKDSSELKEDATEANLWSGWSPKTLRIILATMGVGIGEITHKNAPDFWVRMKMLGLAEGMSISDIDRHIGLRTNVFPNEPQAQWLKRVYEQNLRSAKYDMSKHLNGEDVKVLGGGEGT